MELYVILVLCGVVLVLLVLLLILLIWLLVEERSTGSRKQMKNQPVGTVMMQGGVTSTLHATALWSVQLQNMDDGRRYQVVIDHPVVIGRTLPEYRGYNEVGISQSDTVSKRQCLIFEMNGQLFLQNLSQVNVTLLNGCPVQEPALLHQNDVIQAAEVRLRVYMLRIGAYARS